MDINNFDIRDKNIRVFTNNGRITIQELTEEPRGKYFTDNTVTPGVFKYVWKYKSIPSDVIINEVK